MWLIKSLVDGRELFLLPGKSYVVGRKQTDLILEGDASISRMHAVLAVSENATDLACVVTLKEMSPKCSKYGTFTKKANGEWEKISVSHDQRLGNGDVIRFGVQSELWMVKKCLVSSSNLTAAQRKSLVATLAAVSAGFSPGWTEYCTHLTMNSVTLTVKAVCALARGIPIVTPGYWERYLTEQNLPAARTSSFIPPFGERAIDPSRISLDVNEKRKHLFVGLCFVFANQEQLEKKGCLVISAGGEAVAFDAVALSLEELCRPHMILVNYFCNESQESFTEFAAAIAYSEARGRRRVPEAEIGMAILDCSIERNCNPLYRPLTSLLQTICFDTQTQSMSQLKSVSQVLVYETQDSHVQESRRNIPRNIVIPESGSSSKDIIKKETQDETPDMLAPQTVMETDRGKGSRKRQGDTQMEEPHFKRPTAVDGASLSLFSGKTSTVRGLSIPDDTEDSKDFLDLDSGNRHIEDEDDPFNFTKSGREHPSLKRTSLMEAGDTSDDDLFGSLTPKSEEKRVKLEVSSRLEPEETNEDEDMFSTDEPDNARITPLRSVANEVKHVNDSSMKGKSRKSKNNVETNKEDTFMSSTKFVQKYCSVRNDEAQLNMTTSYTDKSHLQNMSKVSLKGFLFAVKVEKKEPIDVTDLQDAIECLVVVEKKHLVVRRTPAAPVDISVPGSALLNFKRFRKVMPSRRRPMIDVVRTSALREPGDNVCSLSEDEDRVAESQQCFDFVTKKRVQ